MSSMPSITSIRDLGTSSAHALPTNSMTPCYPGSFDKISIGMGLHSGLALVTGDTGYWSHETADAQFMGTVTVTGEVSGHLKLDTMYLLVAYSLLRAMPQEGLEETCQSLKDIFEFYSIRSQKVLPSPSVQRVKARLRPPVKRSGFRIEED